MVLGRIHVVPVAAGFMEAYPDITLNLRLNDRVLDLQEEHVDVAVRIGELPDSAMLARKLGRLRRIVCASSDYLARRGVPDTPADIAGHECVTFRGFERPEGWVFAGKSGKAIVPVRSRVSLDTAEAVVEAGIAGMGLIRVFCYHVVPAIREGKLKPLLLDFELEGPPVHILHPGGGLMPLKVRAFLDYTTARLQARLAASSHAR
jgi:DNA-binding transcriptional LysR family regulator